MNCRNFFVALCLFAGAFAPQLRAETPQWIWSPGKNEEEHQVRYFRTVYNNRHAALKAELTASADDKADIFINGKKVASVDDWGHPAQLDVAKELVEGDNVIAARCENTKGKAGFILKLEVTQPTLGSAKQKFDPSQHAGLRWINLVVTDTSWLVADQEVANWNKGKYDTNGWRNAVSVAKLGDKPWGDIFTTAAATAAETLTVLPGFKVELLHSATANEGSWVSMAVDRKGRLIVSPQHEGKLQRITIADGQVKKIEAINQPIGQAMGLLYAEKSLFVNGMGPKGLGIYRMREKWGKYEAPVLIRALQDSAGEHGSHGLALGPDHKLYVVSGNFTKVPKDILPSSPHKNYAEDQLLPRDPDGSGFGNGVLPPGGFVLRMDLDGKNCELFGAGSRNTYDIAFNADGELFGFDSDMEWDWGTPWYRPIRVNHWVSGADFGFREGTGKFPEYYQDTLPATKRIGIGSPTGVKFGTASNWPEKYRKAFFMMDWSYGRIFAVQMEPKGATYEATSVETLVRGKPLNVTDFEFGHDGAMYFLTGGRHTQAGLYRVTYVGPKVKETKTSDQVFAEKKGKKFRELRHTLEKFHGVRGTPIVNAVWPDLKNEDSWIRYTARIALEFQDPALWKDRAISETNPNGGLTALLALARCGGKETQRDLLMALKKFPMNALTEEQQLLKLRVIELSFIRQGRPDDDIVKLAISKLDPLYPAKSESLNRELCQILLYLGAPDAIAKTLDLLDKAPTQEEQINYIFRLRNITNGWTLDQRKKYFAWFDKDRAHLDHPAELVQFFKDAERDYSDGSSFPKFIANFRKEAIETLSAEEHDELASLLVDKKEMPIATREHKFIKEWKMSDVLPSMLQVKRGRSYDNGKEAFIAAQCIQCHRFGNQGGSVGPELTAVASRFASRDILESILEPSKVVSEQYQNTMFTLKNGDDVIGRVVEEKGDKLTVMTDPLKQTKVDVKKADIQSRQLSKLSPMPEGLANILTRDEILDLIAYLESGGKKKYKAFTKQ